MGGLFGGGQSTPSSSPVTSLRLQTSTRGRPVPLVYGKTRVAGNLIWYGDFTSTSQQQSAGGKGGGGQTTTSYTYSTALILGICEGAINAITRIWREKELYTGTTATSQQFTVQDESYIVPGSPYKVTVSNASHFFSNTQVTVDLGDGGRTLLSSGVDYSVAAGVYTFISSYTGYPVYITYRYSISNYTVDASSQLGLTFTPGTYSQVAQGWMTTKHPSQAIGYRGLAYVSSSSYPLGSQADLQNHSFELDTQFAYSTTIRDANPKDVIIDLLTNPHYGSGFPAGKFGDLTTYSNFCVANNLFVSPAYVEQMAVSEMLDSLMKITNSGIVYSEGKLKILPYGDVAATANGVTFTPNLTPLYDLTDDDFLGDGTEDPIRITRKTNADAYNQVRVKFYSRDNNYNEDIAEAKDQANIELYGLRAMDVIEMKEICDSTAARTVAQLVLQRQLYIRNTYEFRLGWNFALLEPMDLVTLTDVALGMNKAPARIVSIEEDEYGELTITAEEFPLNVLNAATYNIQPPVGYATNYNVSPGSAFDPAIFEAPVELAVSPDGLDIWLATGGGANYGGCEIWVSTDNSTYKMVDTLNGSSRYGVLTANLNAQIAPGIYSQTMRVLLSAGGQLLSGTEEDLDLLNTLCYVGGEYLAYQTASLTAPSAYNLSTLNRGAYDSGESKKFTNADFVRCDDGIAKIPLTDDYIGKTIYIKLLAFNQYGGAKQALSDVTAIPYVVTGNFASLPPPDVQVFTLTVRVDATRQFAFSADNAPTDVIHGGGYRIKYRTAGTTTVWASMTALNIGLLTQSPYETNSPIAGSYDFGIVAVDKLGNESLEPIYILGATIGNEPVTYGAAANMLANSDWSLKSGVTTGIEALYKWSLTSTMTTPATITQGSTNALWNPTNGGAVIHDNTSNIGTGSTSKVFQVVAAVAGTAYEGSVYAGAFRCQVSMSIEWLNSSMAVIGSSITDSFNAGSTAVGATSLSADVRLWASGTAPVNTAFARFSVVKQATNAANSDSYAFFNRAMMCIARTGITRQTATPWIEAGIDFFHGGGLEPFSVGGPQITANAATDIILSSASGIDCWVDTGGGDGVIVTSVDYVAPNDLDVVITVVGSLYANFPSAASGVKWLIIKSTTSIPIPTSIIIRNPDTVTPLCSGPVISESLFSLTAGESATFLFIASGGFYVQPVGGFCLFNDVSMKLESIKK